MSKFTKIYYTAIRIITSVLILLSIYGVIKNFHDGEKISEYSFIFINALVLLVASLLPGYLKKYDLVIPNLVLILYLTFITCALLLGEIGGFFKTVRHWDSFLHLTSGGLIAFLGLSVAYLLNERSKGFKLSPFFVVIFAFCFATTIGVVWEIVEFLIDRIFSSNMQRYKDNFTGVPFVGQKALLDTMKDYMLNTLGALVASVIGYVDIKRESYILNRVLIKRDVDKEKALAN